MKRLLAAAALLAMTASPALGLDRKEQAMIAAVDQGTARAEALLETLVNVNSGTLNLKGVETIGAMMKAELEPLGFAVRWVPMGETQRAGHIVAEKRGRGTKMLLIGHLDTVFEPASPFQTYKKLSPTKAEGPGVNDMKGGLVVMLQALRAMKTAGTLKDADITIVLTGDEERVGRPLEIARRDLRKAAERADIALEFETLAQVDGVDHASISRRGGTQWRLEVSAVSGHSSRIFSDRLGNGAIFELARILDAFRRELRPEPYLTYNVGVALGGAQAAFTADGTGGSASGKSNIIPGVALAYGDIRTLTIAQADKIKEKMRAIAAQSLPGAKSTLTFGDSGPGMPPTDGSRKLMAQLNAINAELGLPAMPELDPMMRGGGDISDVAHLIEGGLVGTGAAGDGAHAAGETVDLTSLPRQAKRAAILMYRLSKERR